MCKKLRFPNKEKEKEQEKRLREERKQARNKQMREFRKKCKENTDDDPILVFGKMAFDNYNKQNSNDVRVRYHTDPEFKKRTDENSRKWAKANPEKVSMWSKAWRAANPEKVKEIVKQWRKTHPEESRLISKNSTHKRRCLVKNTKNTFKLAEWKLILIEQNNQCKHCKREFTEELPPTIDHILPVTRGGEHTYTNIQALCKPCNSRKGNKLESELEYLKEPLDEKKIPKITDWLDEEETNEEP